MNNIHFLESELPSINKQTIVLDNFELRTLIIARTARDSERWTAVGSADASDNDTTEILDILLEPVLGHVAADMYGIDGSLNNVEKGQIIVDRMELMQGAP
jgi:hypothetical protein